MRLFFSGGRPVRPKREYRRLALEALETRRVLSALVDLPDNEPIIHQFEASESTVVPSHSTGHGNHIDSVASTKSGNWEDPATWGGTVPHADADVSIAHAVSVTGIVHARSVTIRDNSELLLAGEVHAHGSVLVYGKLVANAGRISFHVPNDQQFAGIIPGNSDFHPDDIGLWVLHGGEVDFRGAEVTSWLNAVPTGPQVQLKPGVSSSRAIGAGYAKLASAPIGWLPGDTLLLVSEKGDHALATLLSTSGSEVHYRLKSVANSSEDFTANALLLDGEPQIHPKVANLTRRILIDSHDVREGSTNHRAHIAIMHGAKAHLESIEVRNLGPRGILGRYPIHWHHGGHVEGSLVDSSIWQDVDEGGNRFVALHRVSGVRVENNVAYRSQGHGFFMENGPETGNAIIGNLSVAVMDGEELAHADANLSRRSHHFWVRVGNTIERNVSAGGTAFGLVLLPSTDKSGSESVVYQQEALGGGNYGMWAMHSKVRFLEPRAAYNGIAGLSISPAWSVDASEQVLEDAMFLFNGTDPGNAYNAQIFLNNAPGLLIQGGVFVGEKAIHTHYNSSFDMHDARIIATSLLTPTYWEMTASIVQSDITVEKMFDRGYPLRRYEPGILRVSDTRIEFANGHHENILTEYFVGAGYARTYGWTGSDVDTGGFRLSLPPVPTGYIINSIAEARYWRLWREGNAPTGWPPHIPRANFITRWSSSGESLAIYTTGIPPGEFYIELKDVDFVTIGIFKVAVVSGLATSELIPVVYT